MAAGLNFVWFLSKGFRWTHHKCSGCESVKESDVRSLHSGLVITSAKWTQEKRTLKQQTGQMYTHLGCDSIFIGVFSEHYLLAVLGAQHHGCYHTKNLNLEEQCLELCYRPPAPPFCYSIFQYTCSAFWYQEITVKCGHDWIIVPFVLWSWYRPVRTLCSIFEMSPADTLGHPLSAGRTQLNSAHDSIRFNSTLRWAESKPWVEL